MSCSLPSVCGRHSEMVVAVGLRDGKMREDEVLETRPELPKQAWWLGVGWGKKDQEARRSKKEPWCVPDHAPSYRC